MAYILGVAYGDGHISIKQRRIILSATDKDFVLNFKNELEKWSEFKARFFTRRIKLDKYIKNRKIQYVSYIDSIESATFLKNFDLSFLIKAEDKVKCAFIKGFFDSEGTVLKMNYYDKNVGLSCSNTKIKLVFLIKELLESLSMEPKINITKTKPFKPYLNSKPVYVLWIHKKESILKYYSLIGFSILRKQERLVKQINYIKMKLEVKKMDERPERKDEDMHTVFIGSKPFMKFK